MEYRVWSIVNSSKNIMRSIFSHRNDPLDFAVVSGLLILAYTFSLYFSANLMSSVIMYFAVPAAYLCWRRQKNYKKIILASATLGLLLGMGYNIVAEFYGAWITNYNNSILDFRIIGKTPIGDFVWAFLIPFSIIVFYEHFLDDEKVKSISSHWKQAVVAAIFIFLTPVIYFALHPNAKPLPFSYLMVGIISMLPLAGLLFKRRRFVHKLFVISIFYFVLNLLFEISALTLNQWRFPGEYIGWMTFAGVRFPLEEFFLWIIPSTAVFLFCYEMLFDDGK